MKIPEIPNLGQKIDRVSFHAESRRKPHEVSKHMGAACYAGYVNVGDTPRYNFTCIPYNNDSGLAEDIFEAWIELCKANGLMPNKTKVQKDKTCYIPGSEGRHIVYSALCCYRWADVNPKISWMTVKLLENNPNINFFQSLHYSLAKCCAIGSGHGFIPISTNHRNYLSWTGGHNFWISNRNLLSSIAAANFFRKGKAGRSLARKVAKTGYTQTKLADVIKQLGFDIKEISSVGSEKKLLEVPKINYILRDELAPMYEKKLTKNKLIGIYYDVFPNKESKQ